MTSLIRNAVFLRPQSSRSYSPRTYLLLKPLRLRLGWANWRHRFTNSRCKWVRYKRR